MLAVLLVAPSAQAQETTPDTTPSVIAALNLGLGFAPRDFGAQAALTVSHSSGDYIVRMATSSDFEVFRDEEWVVDVALLYGLRSRGNDVWIRAAVGPARVWHKERLLLECQDGRGCTYEMRRSAAIGFASQVDLVWGPVPGFGLGLGASGNLNRAESFGILTLNLFLGRNR